MVVAWWDDCIVVIRMIREFLSYNLRLLLFLKVSQTAERPPVSKRRDKERNSLWG